MPSVAGTYVAADCGEDETAPTSNYNIPAAGFIRKYTYSGKSFKKVEFEFELHPYYNYPRRESPARFRWSRPALKSVQYVARASVPKSEMKLVHG
jgi:hypothetical protein